MTYEDRYHDLAQNIIQACLNRGNAFPPENVGNPQANWLKYILNNTLEGGVQLEAGACHTLHEGNVQHTSLELEIIHPGIVSVRQKFWDIRGRGSVSNYEVSIKTAYRNAQQPWWHRVVGLNLGEQEPDSLINNQSLKMSRIIELEGGRHILLQYDIGETYHRILEIAVDALVKEAPIRKEDPGV